MAPLFGVIKNLQPGKSKIALQLRLIRSYDILKFNKRDEAFSHECIFHDKEGSRIHASVNCSSIQKIKPMLTEGNVYAIKDFVITTNSLKFKTTESTYKILLFKQTRITELEDHTFPNHTFNLKNFDEIATINDVQNIVMFDIVGIVVSSYQPITKDLNGQPTKLMDIILEDLEGKTMSCTLWEQYADKIYEYLCREPKMPTCVILQFCRPTMFRGEVRITSSYNVTNLIFDENVAEIKEMKHNFFKIHKERSINLKLLVAPAIRTIEDEINDGIAELKTISELTGQKNGMFWIYGTICEVETIGAWAYLACKICLKKLKNDDDKFFCDNCASFDVSGRLRYKLRVCVADNSGSASFILWDRECLQLIGKPAEEVSCDAGGNDLPFEIDAITNKNALFKINIKVGESKMFDGAYIVTKINCDPNIITKYCGSSVENAAKETQLKDTDIEDTMVGNGSGSDNLSNTARQVNISDEETTNKRLIDEMGPIVMNKRGKRVVIKKEKT